MKNLSPANHTYPSSADGVVTAITKGSTYTTFTVSDSSKFVRNTYVYISGLSGTNWTDLNNTYAYIKSVSGNDISLLISSSTWADYGSVTGSEQISQAGLAVNLEPTFNITDISSSAIFTIVELDTPNHLIHVGQLIHISGVSGMTEINDLTAVVFEIAGYKKIKLYLNSAGFSAYTSGGVATKVGGTILMSTRLESSNTYACPAVVMDESDTNIEHAEIVADVKVYASEFYNTLVDAKIGCMFLQMGLAGATATNSFPYDLTLLDYKELSNYTYEFFKSNISIFSGFQFKALYNYPQDGVSGSNGTMSYGFSINLSGSSGAASGIAIMGEDIIVNVYLHNISDENGKVDVGKINGETPMSETDIATEVATEMMITPSNKFYTDSNGFVKIEGANNNTLDDIAAGGLSQY